MPVRGVYLTADCYSVCLAHALTTEKEEIMGLLIGEVSCKSADFLIIIIVSHEVSSTNKSWVKFPPGRSCIITLDK